MAPRGNSDDGQFLADRGQFGEDLWVLLGRIRAYIVKLAEFC
jgi:hypothetical protein